METSSLRTLKIMYVQKPQRNCTVMDSVSGLLYFLIVRFSASCLFDFLHLVLCFYFYLVFFFTWSIYHSIC